MNSISEGYMLLVIGMGVVFSFLILLIISIIVSSKFVAWLNKIYPEPVVETKKKIKKTVKNNDDIALVVAAVKAFNS